MEPGNVKLPQMTDVHHLFNPAIAPPLVATKTVISGASGLPGSAGNTVRGVTKLLKGIQRKNSKHDLISLPTNFRHIVHIGSDRVEVYDESGFALGGGERKKQNLEVDLVRKNGGFGMNIKTLDNGKTIVSLVQPNGSAESLGIQVNDEISHVDGEPIEGLKHEDVIAKIKGKNMAKLKLVRYISLAAPASPSLPNANEQDQPEGMGCRVCGALASFNCSSCGPHITYCSVDCQKADWPNHKADCQSMKSKQKEESDSNVPATGACRVCRAKNARFRCVCGTSMYCSQECQLKDWPNHKNSCTSQEPDGKTLADPSKLSFFAVAERWLSKMAFVNGVFDCKWTIPLASQDDKIPMYPTLHVVGKAVFVAYADRLSSIDADSGSPNWSIVLGFPFDGSAVSIVDHDDIIIVAGLGTISAHTRRTGELVWRKLLNRSLAPVTMLIRSNVLFATSGENSFCIIVEDDEASLAWRTVTSPGTGPKPLSLVEGAHNNSFLAVGAEKLQLLKAFDGNVEKTRNQGDSFLAVTMSAKNDIFLTLRNGTLTRYNTRDLAPVWEVKIPECENCEGTLLQNTIVFQAGPGETPSTTPSDVVYVGISCRVAAVDAKDGEIKWVAKLAKHEPGVNGTVSMILLGDDIIAATGGRVFALSGNSGTPLRKAQLPQKDNPTRFVYIVASDYSERTVSCVANMGALYTRL